MGLGVVRPGGAVSRVGLPQYEERPSACRCSAATSPSPAGSPRRAHYIAELLPDVLDGKYQPGRVFDRTIDVEGVPDGYRAMADREALKVLIKP